MSENLQFLFCVLVLAATGAATVRVFLPNVPDYAKDRRDLEAVAWLFTTGSVLLLAALTLLVN
ncbi:hypothetical protein [Chthonobacter albigriseus]|uniref:hypothetical protein n=1 Tax=Chthonobacter albigriseus TaxID=1683161 RepID=UPI0015EE619E|nr:hypothetical protein [Chthonobacter albigriseus]